MPLHVQPQPLQLRSSQGESTRVEQMVVNLSRSEPFDRQKGTKALDFGKRGMNRSILDHSTIMV